MGVSLPAHPAVAALCPAARGGKALLAALVDHGALGYHQRGKIELVGNATKSGEEMQMRARILAVAFLCLAGVTGTAGHGLAQQWYAAVDANNDGSLQVVWDTTKDGASQKAVAACKRASKTCSGLAAHTD